MATRYTVSDGKLVLKLEMAEEGGVRRHFSPRSRIDYGGGDDRRSICQRPGRQPSSQASASETIASPFGVQVFPMRMLA